MSFCKLLFGKVLYDVTEICTSLNRTGIQRVTVEFATRWPNRSNLVPFIWKNEKEILILDGTIFDLLKQNFVSENSTIRTLSILMHGHETASETKLSIKSHIFSPIAKVKAEDALNSARAIYNTELFFDRGRISAYEQLLTVNVDKIFFLIYDFVIWLNPQLFSGFDASRNIGLSRWIHLVRQIKNLSFISDETKRDYIYRICRKPSLAEDKRFTVLTLGSDAMGERNPLPIQTNHFLVLGSIEPRKHGLLIAEVFDRLIKEGNSLKLCFIGKIFQYNEVEKQQFIQIVSSNPNIEWEIGLGDDEIRELIVMSRATIYLGEYEGFGLPPLESLSLGVPVITSDSLPSLKGLAEHGQIRIKAGYSKELYNAVLAILSDEHYSQKLTEIDKLSLPSWTNSAFQAADWIDNSLGTKQIPTSTILERMRAVYFLSSARNLPHSDAFVTAYTGINRSGPSGAYFSDWLDLLQDIQNSNAFGEGFPLPLFLLSEVNLAANNGITPVDLALCLSSSMEFESQDHQFFHEREARKEAETFLLACIEALESKNDEVFLSNIYKLLISRLPDQVGLTHYKIQLNNKPLRWSVVNDLINSQECRNIIKDEYVVKNLKVWVSFYNEIEILLFDESSQFIERAYQFLLKRQIDIEGYKNYGESGSSNAQILLSMVLSNEFVKLDNDPLLITGIVKYLVDFEGSSIEKAVAIKESEERLTRSRLAALISIPVASMFLEHATHFFFNRSPIEEEIKLIDNLSDMKRRHLFLKGICNSMITAENLPKDYRLKRLINWLEASIDN